MRHDTRILTGYILKPLMQAGSQVGVYKVLSVLGAGGMAKVYLAQDSRLGRKVALKVLPADAVKNPERVRRFEQEARAASALNHPNILTIYDIGDVDSTKFIATEFVEGETVRELLIQPVPLLRALDIGLQAAAALATAHAAGIVHRDIKPENIMVRPDGFVKVLDFGLAKLTQTSPDSIYGEQTLDVTMPGVVMGTLGYMSPEQLRGQDVDARSDVFSLGAVLYEMVTGNAPFAAPTPTDSMVAVLHRDPAPVRNLRNEAPEELERILSKALAKERDERYQTVKDLAIDLKRLKQKMESDAELRRSGIATIPSTAQPVVHGRRGGKLIVPVSLAVVIALALLGFEIWNYEQHSSSQAPNAAPQQPQTVPEPPEAPTPGSESPAKPKETNRTPSGTANPAPNTGMIPNIEVPAVPDMKGLPTRKGERQLTYSLLAQKMQGRKPVGPTYRLTVKDVLQSGSQFSFIFASPESGHLYLVDEPENGSPEILFPNPKVNNGESRLAANKGLQIGPYNVDQNPGKEKLWIVWSSVPVFELQLAFDLMKNPTIAKYSGSESITPQIQSFLRQHKDPASHAEAQPSSSGVKLVSHVDPLVYAVELQHR